MVKLDLGWCDPWNFVVDKRKKYGENTSGHFN